MVTPRLKFLALTCSLAIHLSAEAATAKGGGKNDIDRYQTWRAAAARTLTGHRDVESLATGALLTFAGSAARAKADTAKAAAAAHELAFQASELAPYDPSISWLVLQFCTNAPGCDVRDAATTMRWVDADNGAAWMPTLSVAQKDKDQFEIDRVLAGMAQGARFDVYSNRLVATMFESLKRVRAQLPAGYVSSDFARLTEALGIAEADVVPSFSPLINACREATTAERRANCYKLSKVLQRGDTIMAQTVGLAVERRLSAADGKDLRAIDERRRTLEWRVAMANEFDTPKVPWIKDARARSRLAKMRAMAREEDVCIAILREHQFPTEPPDDR